MKTEEAIESIGFGFFQKRIMSMGFFAGMLSGMITSALVFQTYSPNFRCAIPGLENDTYSIADPYHEYLLNLTIPGGEDGECNVYGGLNATTDHTEVLDTQGSTMRTCDEWVYDKSLFTSTVVTEFNFVCDKAMVKTHSRMTYLLGFLVGGFVFGVVADYKGRKVSYVLSVLTFLASVYALPWISSGTAFPFMTLALGLSCTGIYLNMFVISMEFVEKKLRVLTATVVAMGWVCGLVYGIAFAYFIRDWKTLQMAIFYPTFIMLGSIRIVPESIRWLVSHEKYRQAEDILQTAAKINRTTLHDIYIDRHGKKGTEEQRTTMLSVLKSPLLLKRFMIIAFSWLTCSMVYYGLTLNAGNVSGDVFLELFLSSLIEAPAYILIFFTVNRTGRKSSHIAYMTISAFGCIGTLFPVLFDKIGLQPLTMTLATIGKAAVSAAFQMVYIYTPELFPTTLRLSVVGASSCVGRIGAMVGPYIVELGKVIGGDYSTIIPLLIFGGTTFLAGVLCILVPETKGKELPDTIEDATNLNRKKQNKFGNAAATDVIRHAENSVEFNDFDSTSLLKKSPKEPDENNLSSAQIDTQFSEICDQKVDHLVSRSDENKERTLDEESNNELSETDFVNGECNIDVMSSSSRATPDLDRYRNYQPVENSREVVPINTANLNGINANNCDEPGTIQAENEDKTFSAQTSDNRASDEASIKRVSVGDSNEMGEKVDYSTSCEERNGGASNMERGNDRENNPDHTACDPKHEPNMAISVMEAKEFENRCIGVEIDEPVTQEDRWSKVNNESYSGKTELGLLTNDIPNREELCRMTGANVRNYEVEILR